MLSLIIHFPEIAKRKILNKDDLNQGVNYEEFI